MKEAFRIGLLKFSALLAINIYIYSAAIVLRSIIFKDNGGVFSIGLYVAVLLTGVLIARFLQNENLSVYKKIAGLRTVKMLAFIFNITEKTRFIASVTIYISLLLPFLAALLSYKQKGVLRTIFEAIVTLLPYLVSIKHRYSGYSGIMGRGSGAAGFIILAAALETAVLSSRAVNLKPYLFAAAYVYMLLFLILKNQDDIDDNIYDRKHIEKAILPRNLRSFNMLAVVALFFVIFILFNLKSAVLWLMDMAGRAVILLAGLLQWLAGLIFPAAGGQDSQNAQMPDFGFFGGSSEIHPFSNFAFNVIKYFIMLYIVYRLALFLIRRLPSIAGRIMGFLKRLLSWGRDNESGNVRDYDDETEIVKPQKEHDRRQSVRKLLRSAGRDLRTIKDPVERIRFIYASILEILRVCGIPAEKSDTTLDILKKALVIRGMDKPLHEVTNVYNEVRYGNCIPGQETLSETGLRYQEAVELIKTR